MGLRHRTHPTEGVQFHPESVLTPDGPHLLANFLRLAGEGEAGILDAATGSFATRGLGVTEGMSEAPPRAPAPSAEAVHHALLIALGHQCAGASLGEEGVDAGAAGADALGHGALRIEF